MSWTLPELIDIPNLQMLMDRFHAATGIPVGIIAIDGQILVATGWQEICTAFHRTHPVTAERCRQSDDCIKTRLATENYVQYKCRNGLWDLAVPIIIAGKHVATLFLGQFNYDDEEIDEEFFLGQAREFGFDLDRYMAALSRIPVFTRERVRRIMDFYASFVDFLVSVGLANYRQGETEKTLRESEERYRTLFEGANDTIFTIRDGCIVNCNRKALEMFGCTMEEFIGNRPEQFSPPMQPEGIDSAAKAREKITAALAGPPQFFEWRHRRSDGTSFDVEVSLNRLECQGNTELLAIIRDITERKRAEEALRESEEKFAKAFSSTPSLLVISTIAEGRYIEVNEAFERFTGYRREEAIGRTSIELNIWEAETRTRFLEAIRKEGRVRDFEANFRSKSGEHHAGLLSAEVIEIKGEQRLLVLVNDITARKRMEEEIEILNTDLASHAMELEAANRELEAFNYTVSHDLRSPLTGITGYSQLLLDSYAVRLGDPCMGYVREIHEAAERMEQLIDTLLSFSRLLRCTITRETVDLTGLATVVAVQLKMTAPCRQVAFTVAEEMKVEGDAKLLRVVVENLLGNAWKYTGNRETALIEFGVAEINGGTAYFVRDNGAGFDMAHADKLFRPFQRLPGTTEFAGHGVGLATVQRIIQRHGGQVWAMGEPGKGATFYFTLHLSA
jgi:PAS domain S-box-containing protein